MNGTQNDGDGACAILDAIIVHSILHEHHEGNDPLVDYRLAHACLLALGRPLTTAMVRDLNVDVRTVGGPSVAPLRMFQTAADDYLQRRMARPSLKRAAAAKARAARCGAAPEPADAGDEADPAARKPRVRRAA